MRINGYSPAVHADQAIASSEMPMNAASFLGELWRRVTSVLLGVARY